MQSIRNVMCFLSLGFCAAILPGSVSAQSCTPSMPAISINVTNPSVQYTDAYDVAFATGQKYAIESKLPNGAHLRGVAMYQLGYQTRFRGSGNYQCYMPQSIEVFVGLQDPIRVAIDARYFQNSCNYQAILEHENQHVAIARAAVSNNVTALRLSIEQAVIQALPYLGSTANAEGEFHRVIAAAIVSGVAPMETEMRARNAEIDTPQSYQMVQNLCPEW